MGRAINFVYGGVLVYLALDVLFLHLIPEGFAQYLLIAMGVLILLTPAGVAGIPTPLIQQLRKWGFGIFVLAMGVLSAFGQLGQYIPQITMYSTTGPWILLAIGGIYFLSAFQKYAGMRMATV